MTYPLYPAPNNGGSLSRARGAEALAQGLSAIGEFLQREKDRKEEEQTQLSTYAAERGGGMGAIPNTPATPARPAVVISTPPSASVPFRQGGSAVLDDQQDDGPTRPVTTSPAVAGTPSGPDPRYVKIGSGDAIGYVLRPDQRPDALLAAANAARQGRATDAQAEYLRAEARWRQGQTDLAGAEAGWYGRRPAGRGTGGTGAAGRMTRPQAQAVLRRDPQYYDFAGQALKSPIGIKMAEDSLMSGTMAPRAAVDTTVAPPPTPSSGGFHPLDAIGRVLGLGGTSRPAPSGAPASGSSVSPVVAPRQPVTAPAPAASVTPPTAPSAPQGMAADKIPVAQADYDDIVALKGADYAQRYYQVQVR